VRILIVDDHEVVRHGVRALLSTQADFEVCGEAVDGMDAITKATELKPDVIVMDISMPNLNGLDATRRIRGLLPLTEVVILSQHDSAEMVRQAFDAGARGYVVKSSVPKDLLATLRKVSQRESSAEAAKTEVAKSADGVLDAKEILQRSRAFEQALQESEERFRSTFELAPVGVAHVAPDGRWLRFNRRLSQILGYSQVELATLSYPDITHPDDRSTVLAEAAKILAGTSEEFSIERRFTRKDGSVGWANLMVSGVRYADRTVKYFICIVDDVTARRSGDEARLWLEAVVDSSDDAIVSKNLDGIINSWNGGAERIFGWTAEEAIGKPVTLIIPQELHEEESSILRRIRAGKGIASFETVRVTKYGKKLNVSLTISPVKNSAGQVIGASKIGRDITRQKLAEAELKKAHEELEQRVEERTHELREKNEELLKQTELVRELSARLLQLQDEERRHIARELHDSVGQFLAAMSMNIGAVRREKDKLSSTAAQCVVDNGAILEQLSAEIRTMSYLLHPPLLDETGLGSALKWYIEGFMDRSKIDVRLELPPDVNQLSRELQLSLFRIVQECLTNIHRHSGSATALVRLSESPGQIKLEVTDHGKGIPREKLRAPAGTGLGVGLRGMRERVRQLGGDLEVQSNGHGTTISAMVPVIREESSKVGA
jgi:PAS domain S-box-containing protein